MRLKYQPSLPAFSRPCKLDLEGVLVSTVHSNTRGASLVAGALAVVLFITGSFSQAQAQPQEKPVLLLLPVRVHSSENPTYLREGLADMLVARFRQAGAFQLKEVTDPAKSTTNLSQAVATAQEEGADFVLFGSFTRFGAGASLDMQAATTQLGGQDESMREIFVHSGSIAEVIPDLDDLVGKVSQFAIVDYSGSPDEGGGEARQAPISELEQLKQRVSALEAQAAGSANMAPGNATR